MDYFDIPLEGEVRILNMVSTDRLPKVYPRQLLPLLIYRMMIYSLFIQKLISIVVVQREA
jgi:hypothetical protein